MRSEKMSDEWTQEGRLGLFSASRWQVQIIGDCALVSVFDPGEGTAGSSLVLPRNAQQLRDFAQALIRAAEQLESRALKEEIDGQAL
jgi:hypothetical protein